MPLYEYQCENCGKSFEKIVRSSLKDDEMACPQCGRYKLKKKISLFSSLGSSDKGKSSGSWSGFT